MKERELNFVNNLNNRVRKRYYCDDSGEINSVPVEENDQIYSINDNQLYQVELNDTEETLNGSIITFNGRNRTKIEYLEINIDPVQDLHGYDSPWPAGGGKNKLNPDLNSGLLALTVGSTDTSPTATTRYGYTNKIPADTQVTVSVKSNNLNTFNWVNVMRYVDGVATQVVSTQTLSNTSRYIINVSGKEGSYIRVQFGAPSGMAVGSQPDGECQAEYSAGATTYAPYSNICPISGWSAVNVWNKPTYDPTANPTATIQLGQTVYGGTLDVTNGVLTVDRAIRTITAFSGAWGATSNGFAVFDTVSGGIRNTAANVVSNMFTKSGNNYSKMPTWSFSGGSGASTTITFVLGNGIASKAEADAFAASNPIQYTYCLATPITIPLTPQQISSLLGENNIWADTGDIKSVFITTKGLNIYALDPPKI